MSSNGGAYSNPASPTSAKLMKSTTDQTGIMNSSIYTPIEQQHQYQLQQQPQLPYQPANNYMNPPPPQPHHPAIPTHASIPSPYPPQYPPGFYQHHHQPGHPQIGMPQAAPTQYPPPMFPATPLTPSQGFNYQPMYNVPVQGAPHSASAAPTSSSYGYPPQYSQLPPNFNSMSGNDQPNHHLNIVNNNNNNTFNNHPNTSSNNYNKQYMHQPPPPPHPPPPSHHMSSSRNGSSSLKPVNISDNRR
jgi:hypothetical protein